MRVTTAIGLIATILGSYLMYNFPRMLPELEEPGLWGMEDKDRVHYRGATMPNTTAQRERKDDMARNNSLSAVGLILTIAGAILLSFCSERGP